MSKCGLVFVIRYARSKMLCWLRLICLKFNFCLMALMQLLVRVIVGYQKHSHQFYNEAIHLKSPMDRERQS